MAERMGKICGFEMPYNSQNLDLEVKELCFSNIRYSGNSII